MALKPIQAAEDFVKNAGKKTLQLPRGPKVRKLSEEEATYFKGLFFGPSGSGKTFTLVGLLLHGFKIFVISTDIGGEGLSTVTHELRSLGREDLLDNVLTVILSDYKQVVSFLNDPTSIFPEIYDEGIDFLVWDGFSGFQHNLLSDEIGNMTPERAAGKEVSDARDSGLFFEQQDWNMVKNGTIRNLDKFLKLHNRKTGQVWHKIVTCLEEMKASRGSNGVTYVETRECMLQGSAKKLILPAFDLIINTRITEENGKRSFKYLCAGSETLTGAKTRGLKIDATEEGNMFKLWEKISEQKGIKKGAIDQDVMVGAELT